MENVEKIKKIRTMAYHETKRHADTMFAFNVYPCTIPQDFSFVPLHWQDSMELIYIKRGSGIAQVDFNVFKAQAGDIFVVQPGHLHGLRELRKTRMEYENIIFDMSFIGSNCVDICSQKYLQPLIGGKIAFPPHITVDHPMYGQICACLDVLDDLCARRPTGYELGVKGQLLSVVSLLFQIAREDASYTEENKNMQKIKRVLAAIEENYDKKLTVEDMAAGCGYSASHFMRWFKEATGSAFNAYLIEYRLDRAAAQLRTTGDNILEIAERTGFDNLSNFNRLFKKRFNMTPGQFRKQDL